MWNISTFDHSEDLRWYLMDNNIKPENCHIVYNGSYYIYFGILIDNK